MSDPISREELLEKLSDILTVNECAALISRIHKKKCTKAKRFGLYPIEDWEAFQRMKILESSHWQADEVKFEDDRNDFNELTEEEQLPLIMAFGFFAVGDGSIASMLAYQMVLIADTFEKQCFYIVQTNNERVHGETYGKMIHTLVSDPVKREKIFDSVENVRSIEAMNDFIEQAFTYPKDDRHLYVSLASAEYLLFTPLFCIIFWYRAYKRGKLRQIIFSNEQIAKDECAHCENGCANYQKLMVRYSDEEIHSYIDTVVKLVHNFAEEVLSNIRLPELTVENVGQYVKFVADDLFERLGHSKHYLVANPFSWMNLTCLIPKTNFYEGTVGEYSRCNPFQAVIDAKKLCSGIIDETTNVYLGTKTTKF